MNHGELEPTILNAVRYVYRQYPNCEWDDLLGQAWLIVTEEIDKYDKLRGATLNTFLYNQIIGKLSDYVRRVVLKELNLNGHRVHITQFDNAVNDCTEMIEARDRIDKMYHRAQGVSGDILVLMGHGLTQVEIAEALSISRQRVSSLIKKIRDEEGEL